MLIIDQFEVLLINCINVPSVFRQQLSIFPLSFSLLSVHHAMESKVLFDGERAWTILLASTCVVCVWFIVNHCDLNWCNRSRRMLAYASFLVPTWHGEARWLWYVCLQNTTSLSSSCVQAKKNLLYANKGSLVCKAVPLSLQNNAKETKFSIYHTNE